MKKLLNSLLTGCILLAIGIGYLGNAFGLWGDYTFKLFFPGWWTFFLMLPMLYSFINDGFNFFNLTVFAVGAVLFSSFYIPQLDGKLFPIIVGVVLVVLAIRIILNPLFSKKRAKRITAETTGGTDPQSNAGMNEETPRSDPAGDRYTTSFSGNHIDYTDRPFYGASLEANFGAIELDLRRALINGDCMIDAQSSFAGIKIFLPDDIGVRVEKHSFFGGVDVKKKQSGSVRHTVTVRAEANFGGIEIR